MIVMIMTKRKNVGYIIGILILAENCHLCTCSATQTDAVHTCTYTLHTVRAMQEIEMCELVIATCTHDHSKRCVGFFLSLAVNCAAVAVAAAAAAATDIVVVAV